MIRIREAEEGDVEEVRGIFTATYGEDYPHPEFFDVRMLKKIVFDDDTVLLVAEEEETGRLLGTASIIFEFGAQGDLLGEFGRLAVHPDGRRRGIGRLLMEERIALARDRLHVALVENRASHPFSQKISAACGFVPVGFLPRKLLFAERESIALYARHFGDALVLRKNHPRVIPEAHALAALSLEGCGLRGDAIADDEAASYPGEEGFQLEKLKAEGYSSLFALERGRVAHREVFGPAQLSVGWFKIRASHSHYLVAREGERVAGALGFTLHEGESTINIFEIVSADERPIRFLLEAFVRVCDAELEAEYVEVDVHAHAPRMQRTLLELGFLPVAFVPAMVFHKVERLDCLKMARVRAGFRLEEAALCEASVAVAEAVARNFETCAVVPRLARALPGVGLFAGLNDEQARQLAAKFEVREIAAGETVFREGAQDEKIYLILSGKVTVSVGVPQARVGEVGAGECLGEGVLLEGQPHSATAVAARAAEVGVLDRESFQALARMRPDIGEAVYRNLASGLGEKLRRADERIRGED